MLHRHNPESIVCAIGVQSRDSEEVGGTEILSDCDRPPHASLQTLDQRKCLQAGREHRKGHAVVAVRQIRSTEGAQLRALRLRAIRDCPSAYAESLPEAVAQPQAHWDARAAGEESVLFVAEDASEWVGMVGAYIDEAEGRRGTRLIAMWVSPAHREQGVGMTLAEHVISWARGRNAEFVALWVTEGNAAALSLYTRCGFRSTGETEPLPSNPALMERRMVLNL